MIIEENIVLQQRKEKKDQITVEDLEVPTLETKQIAGSKGNT